MSTNIFKIIKQDIDKCFTVSPKVGQPICNKIVATLNKGLIPDQEFIITFLEFITKTYRGKYSWSELCTLVSNESDIDYCVSECLLRLKIFFDMKNIETYN